MEPAMPIALFGIPDKYNTPLHFACCCYDTDYLRMLLEDDSRIDINAMNAQGWTPLHVACICQEKECVRILLDYGADPTVMDEDQKTPLQHAYEVDNKSIVQLLLQKRTRKTTKRPRARVDEDSVVKPSVKRFHF